MADIDGIWGPKSIAATQLLQKHGGIKVDGIFGVSTENKSREIIDAIQDVLIKYAGALVNDGLAGPATANGTKVFQNEKGLPQTGVVDMNTWNMLMAESSYDEEHNEIVRPSRPGGKFCVSDIRQNQEYHIINVHDWGLFPLATAFSGGWDGMRAGTA